VPPCSGQSRPGPSGGREDAASPNRQAGIAASIEREKNEEELRVGQLKKEEKKLAEAQAEKDDSPAKLEVNSNFGIVAIVNRSSTIIIN
jgi:hypothetical protein